ncbi:unnamed protein product [Rhodiola kirilowii]
MASKIDALESQGTWVLESLPDGKKALDSKWVYTEKRDENGKLIRLKARLVCLGNHQVEGMDYNETFAPAAKMSIVRTFLAVASVKNWEVHQMDVHNAFLHGNNTFELNSFKAYLSQCFKMKDLRALKYFLGLEVARNKEGFYICQRKYALDIILETGLLGAKPADFPMEQNHKLALAEGKDLKDGERYRRLVGRLIYLTVTRPDLAYSVHILSQFMQAPKEVHLEAALRVVRYLKRCPGQGILLRSDGAFELEGWCDSDWASCPLTRRSLTGWFVLLGLSSVSWKTKKQHTVSRSSTEA